MMRVAAGFVLLAFGTASAGTEVVPGPWDGYAGTRIVVQDAANEADCAAKLAALGAGKYTCRTSSRVTVTADPPPAVDCVVSEWSEWILGTWSECANDKRTRIDSHTRLIVTTPANGGAECPALSESRTLTEDCAIEPPAPPALTAPVLDVPLVTSYPVIAGRYNVTLAWAAVAGATSYEVRRCVGAGCTSMTLIKTGVTSNQYTNTNLPAGFTYRYKVRGMKGTEAGPMSEIVTAVTPTEPPPPTALGSATLGWTPPTENTDGSQLTDLTGYRVVYGPSAAALSQSIEINNASMSSYVVNGLSSGTWYFAIHAVSGHGESAQSNVVAKVVQ